MDALISRARLAPFLNGPGKSAIVIRPSSATTAPTHPARRCATEEPSGAAPDHPARQARLRTRPRRDSTASSRTAVLKRWFRSLADARRRGWLASPLRPQSGTARWIHSTPASERGKAPEWRLPLFASRPAMVRPSGRRLRSMQGPPSGWNSGETLHALGPVDGRRPSVKANGLEGSPQISPPRGINYLMSSRLRRNGATLQVA